MKATEARNITNQNLVKKDVIMKQIENIAKSGSSFILSSNISEELILELMNDGYQISKFTDLNGIENTKIKW